MRILLADDDDVACRMIAAALRCAGHEVQALSDGVAAYAATIAPDAPRVLVLDANMRGIRGENIRQHLSRRDDDLYVYVILMTDTTGQKGILDGLESGADAVLVKPFLPEELLAQVSAGERVLQLEAPVEERVMRALYDAAAAGSGEVIVRDGDTVGRIFLHEGRVAWAHLSGDHDFVRHLTAEGVRLTQSDVRDLIHDCRSSDASFTEAIVARGFVPVDRIRDHVQRWIRETIRAMFELRRPDVVFLPSRRPYHGRITFTLQEVLSEEVCQAVEPPRRSSTFPRGSAVVQTAWESAASELISVDSNLKKHLVEALAIEGALSAGMFDGATGACLGAAGKPIPADVAEVQIKAMNLLGTQDDLEDMFTTVGSRQYLTRAVLTTPRMFLIVVLDREASTIAMARLKTSNLARKIVADRRDVGPPSLRRSVSQSSMARVRVRA